MDIIKERIQGTFTNVWLRAPSKTEQKDLYQDSYKNSDSGV